MADRYTTDIEAVEWNHTIDRDYKGTREASKSSKKKDKKAKKSKSKTKDKKPQVKNSKEVLDMSDKETRSSKPWSDRGKGKRPDRQDVSRSELDKLFKAGFIREVDHPEWLANPVMARKSNGKWRMCVDFTDLYKAYPKDDFPLPHIDQLVDSTFG